MQQHARRMAAVLGLLVSLGAGAEVGQVRVKQLPDALQGLWARTQPEMNERSSCAAAFDPGEEQRMTLQCSVHIRMAAEGRRRSLRRCEDKRAELGIRGPCRYVVE